MMVAKPHHPILLQLLLWLILLLPASLAAQSGVGDLFTDNGSEEAPVINPGDLTTNWYLPLTELEGDDATMRVNELLAHIRAQAEAIPDSDVQLAITKDIARLDEALQNWLSLRQQIESPVQLEMQVEADPDLADYLQLGTANAALQQQILQDQSVRDSNTNKLRQLQKNLSDLVSSYRALTEDSANRYQLGINRMTTRVLILNLQLRMDQNSAATERKQLLADQQANQLLEIRNQLEPVEIIPETLTDCDTQQSDQNPSSQIEEIQQRSKQVCEILNDFINTWQLLADEAPLQPAILERVESNREALLETRNRLPELRNQIEQQLLSAAALGRPDADNGNSTLVSLSDGLQQWQQLSIQTTRATLMLQLLDTQQIRGSSSLTRAWYYTRKYVEYAWIQVESALKVHLFSVGDSFITPLSIFRVLLIVWIGWVASKLFRSAVQRFSRHRFIGGESAAWYTLSRLGHYIIVIAALLIGLASIGLDLSNLAIIAGALSVGIGFGLQSIVSNFVSGLILLFERSIKIGDYVDLENGTTGQVRAINTRFTRINTNDNIDILVPNSELVGNRLINWTMHESMRRLHVEFGVAYGTDKELVKKAVLEAADKVSYTVTDFPNRQPEVWLVEFGDSSVNYELLVWLRDGVKRPTRVKAAYLWEIDNALQKYAIEIPFPQRDLHIRSGLHQPEKQTDAGSDKPENPASDDRNSDNDANKPAPPKPLPGSAKESDSN